MRAASSATIESGTGSDTSLRHHVAVVGGGASGLLTAFQLLARSADSDLAVTVHEASGVLGRGVAYGTSDPRHLLNVRARHMSAYADVPSDLLDWARRSGRDPDPFGFLPRQEYAHYLQDTLAAVADHRLTIIAGRVDDLEQVPGGFALHTRDRVARAGTVVLAYGNQAPQPVVAGDVDLAELPGHVPDPWDLGVIRALPDDAVVLLVGSGLTAIDLVITLLEDHPRRRAVMVSRHGLLPHAHIEQQSTAWVSPMPPGELTADGLAEFVRGQVTAARRNDVNWRNVLDGLRPHTQLFWQRLSLEERRRFLATYARHWEVHRHRMAPAVYDRINDYRKYGRLEVLAGGIEGADSLGGRARVRIGGVDAPLVADAVVNCTGPLTDLTRTTDPLLQALQRRGLAGPDPLRLGLATTPDGEVVGAEGVVPGLYAVGPPRKGTLWESTAIPEIRTQAAQVGRAVLAHGSRSRAG
jgi:uncharacterized NAD(P)/FAD-binding protein YdhS